MVALIQNGKKCSTPMQCLSGHCKEGVCRSSEKYSPCRNACPAGFLCHSKNRHCLPAAFQKPAQCEVGPECPWGRYCEAGQCKLRRSIGSTCANHSECVWEAACHEGRCIRKCLNNKECLRGEQCRSIPGLNGFSGCMPRPRKAPSPAPAPPPVKHNASIKSYLGMLKGSFRKHYPLYIGAGMALLVLILVIWIVIRKVRRGKAQAAASALDGVDTMTNSSPLVAQSVYATQPTAPFAYNHASTTQEAPHTGAAPPTYEEIYGQGRDTGAGVSAGGGNTLGIGEESSMPSPYEKS